METQELDQVMIAYSVLLNRPGWLTPDRMDMQRPVWARLFAADDTEGIARLEDCEAAIKAMIKNGPSITELTPSSIVVGAVISAQNRARRVQQMLANIDHPEVFLAQSVAQMRRIVDSGGDPTRAIAAVRATVRADLIAAAVDDDVVMRVLAGVDAVHAPLLEVDEEARARRRQRLLGPENLPPPQDPGPADQTGV